jgi:hypothetical protein
LGARNAAQAHHERDVTHAQLRRERLDVVLAVSLHIRQVLREEHASATHPGSGAARNARAFVIAITVAKSVTKQVMNVMAGLHCNAARQASRAVPPQRSSTTRAHLKRQAQRRARGVVNAKVEEEAAHSGDNHERGQREALRTERDARSAGERVANMFAASLARTLRRKGGTLYSVPSSRPNMYSPCAAAFSGKQTRGVAATLRNNGAP